ncbi:MAG: hypothetical protein ACE5EA_04510 [Nitrospirota bacterium]
MWIIKKIITIFFLIVVFLSGYFLGSHRVGELKRGFIELKSEVLNKTAHLEKEVRRIRIKRDLTEARDSLNKAGTDISNKNFGSAEAEVKESRKNIGKVIELSDKALLKERLISLESYLKDIEGDIYITNSMVRDRIDIARDRVDMIIKDNISR